MLHAGSVRAGDSDRHMTIPAAGSHAGPVVQTARIDSNRCSAGLRPARHPAHERAVVRDAAGGLLQSHRLRRPRGRQPERLGGGADARRSEVHDDLLDALRGRDRADGGASGGARRCPPGALPPHGVAAGHRDAARAPALGGGHPVPLRGLRHAGLPAAPPAAGAARRDGGGSAGGGVGLFHRVGPVATVLARGGARGVRDQRLAAVAGDHRSGARRHAGRLARPAVDPVGGGPRVRDRAPAHLGPLARGRADADRHGALQARGLRCAAFTALLRSADRGGGGRSACRSRPTASPSTSTAAGRSGRSSSACSSTTGRASWSAWATSAW